MPTGRGVVTKRSAVVGLVLFVVPLAALGTYLWQLRDRRPQTRTSVILNRNSLLPHHFAGACVSCHRIRDVGPAAMSADNAELFSLTTQQRRLLATGQRVDVPSVAQRLRMPPILRSDPLPHPYVGVCSNCHQIMAVRPSAASMERAMSRAREPLGASGLDARHTRLAGGPEARWRATWRNVWGIAALALFALTCVYVAMRMLLASDRSRWKGRFALKKWLVVHEWAATGFCAAAIMHWYYSDRGNNLLHLALCVVLWLTLAGFVLRHRVVHKELKKNVRLLHSQRFFFFGLVGLLVAGHFFAGFD